MFPSVLEVPSVLILYLINSVWGWGLNLFIMVLICIGG